MKTTKLIAFVCSLGFCASLLRAEEAKADFSLQTAVPYLKARFTTEVPSQRIAKTAPAGKPGLLSGRAAIGAVLIAFGLFTGTSALIVIGDLLRRAPEGYEDDSGFHVRMRRKRTKSRSHVGLSLAHR